MKKKSVDLNIPADPRFIRVVRLLIAGLGSAIPLPIDEIESLKIAVSEAVNNSIKFAYDKNEGAKPINLRFDIEVKKLTIYVKDKGKGFDPKPYMAPMSDTKELTKFGLFLIRSLMDEVQVKSSKTGTIVKIVKNFKRNVKQGV